MSTITDAPTAACPDGVTLTVKENTTDANALECFEAALVSVGVDFLANQALDETLSSTCLDEAGIAVGSATEAYFDVAVRGTCSPLIVRPVGALENCAAHCSTN